jgi:hypothetical protein
MFDIKEMDRLPVYSTQGAELQATGELPATLVSRRNIVRQNSSVQQRKKRELPKPAQMDLTFLSFGMGAMLRSISSVEEEEPASPKPPQVSIQVASHQVTRI